eukprot:scaffold5668_cov111-Isochrysis_galbana.AAC.18
MDTPGSVSFGTESSEASCAGAASMTLAIATASVNIAAAARGHRELRSGPGSGSSDSAGAEAAVAGAPAASAAAGMAPQSKSRRAPAYDRWLATCGLAPSSSSSCGNSALNFCKVSRSVTRRGILSSSALRWGGRAVKTRPPHKRVRLLSLRTW